MNADYFFGMLSQFETDRVKAHKLDVEACAFSSVPKPFALLLNNIIHILDANLDELCLADERVVLLGFQPSAVTYHSVMPENLGRVISPDRACEHMCCTLGYMVEGLNNPASTWQKTQSLVIDFTSGMVMDGAYFCDLLSNKTPRQGHLLGILDGEVLDTAWRMVRFRDKSKGKPGKV